MMKEETKQEKGHGRHKIDSPKRERSFSKRALKGSLICYPQRCPYCGHGKVLENGSFIKCSKCKKIIEYVQ